MKRVAGCDGSTIVTHSDYGFSKASSGECLPKQPEGGLPPATASHRDDLRTKRGSFPLENRVGTQADTIYNTTQGKRGRTKIKIQKYATEKGKETGNTKTQVLGYVPIQVINLSLEEMKLERQTYIGIASPIQVEPQAFEG